MKAHDQTVTKIAAVAPKREPERRDATPIEVTLSFDDNRLASVAPFFRQDTIAPVSFRSFSQAAGESLQTPESLPHDAGTLSRSLEEQSIDSKEIDALFQL